MNFMLIHKSHWKKLFSIDKINMQEKLILKIVKILITFTMKIIKAKNLQENTNYKKLTINSMTLKYISLPLKRFQ